MPYCVILEPIVSFPVSRAFNSGEGMRKWMTTTVKVTVTGKPKEI